MPAPPSSGSTIALTPNNNAAVEPISVKNRARVPRNFGIMSDAEALPHAALPSVF